MKNILILGISESLFVRDFCIEVFNREEQNIVLLSCGHEKKYEADYAEYDIKIIKWPEFFLEGIKKNLSFNIMGKYKNAIKKLEESIGFNNEIDVIFVHYVEPLHILYFWSIWKKAKKRILVFWGGDILRASKRKMKMLPFFLKGSTGLVFMIQNQYEYFKSIFGNRYDDKIHILDFGNSVLNKIDDVSKKYSKKQCKEKFGLSLDRLSVHVGYNASREQQHLEMMKSIVKWIKVGSSEKWINKLEFVYHISYGKDEEFDSYMKRLKQIMEENNLKYIFIEDYIQGNDLAMFRKTCDIFLYAQKTDARSASPLEYIYAGARFICPEWLWGNYELLNEEEKIYYKYRDFVDFAEVFERCLVDYANMKSISSEEKKVIKEAISWESLAPKWRSLYE